MANKVIIKQFKNKAKKPVAGLTPEHAIYDKNGVRLDAKLGSWNLSNIRDAQTEGVRAVREAAKQYDHQTVINNGTITNAADEEDITVRNNVLSLKDRTYIEGVNEMGYVILRKNKSFTEQVTKENTIYEIRYEFDLNDTEVAIPKGCVLKFEGGKISNGTLVGNNTKIQSVPNLIFSNIILSGIWNANCAFSSWFACGDLILNDNKEVINGTNAYKAFTNLFLFDNIYIDGDYYIEGHLNCHSGQVIEGNNHTLKFKYTNIFSSAIQIISISNVTINGLNCVGWSFEGAEDTEWAHGLSVFGKSSDIIITNCTFNKFRGDGVCLAGMRIDTLLYVPQHIIIDNIICDYNARQGLSLIGGQYVYIKNSKFSNTNTPDGIGAKSGPWAGIDIESNPNTIDGVSEPDPIDHITIEQCEFKDNKGGGIQILTGSNTQTIDEFTTKDIIINNCYFKNNSIDIRQCKNITISNIQIETTGNGIVLENELIDNVKLNNINIIGSYLKSGANGIYLIASTNIHSNITFKNVKVKGFGSYGIFAPNTSTVNNLHFENVHVSNCWHNFFVGEKCTNVHYKNVTSVDCGKTKDGTSYPGWTFGWVLQKYDDIKTRKDFDTMLMSSSGSTDEAPTTVKKGFLYFDTTENSLKVFNGTKYIKLQTVDTE